MSEKNWSSTFTYSANGVHRPESVAAIQALISSGGGPYHALGTRHSFNDVADAPELISLAALHHRPVVDADARTVAVPAGTRYGELAADLQAQGWALGNLASLPHISVAGSVATATHGSGSANQALSSAVVGLTLVDGTGEIVVLDQGSDELAGAIVAVGALGIVTELVLSIEPTFDVRQDVYEDVGWDALTDDFEGVFGAGYSVSAMTNWADDVLDSLWIKSRITDGEPSTMPADLFGGRAATRKLHPTKANDPLHATDQLGVPGPWSERLAHFKLEFTPSTGSEMHSEYLLDRKYAAEAVGALRELGPLVSPWLHSAEIRTVAADELWLSSCYQQESVGFHFTWLARPDEVFAVTPQIEAALAPYRPRPHWGKVFGRYDFEALYPRLPDFRALAERFDPDGRFRTPFVERLLA